MPLTRSQADQAAADAGVIGMPWDEFLAWFRTVWEPGDHLALIGPTKSGKSTFAVAILPLRKWVLALDPKGGDSTLARLGVHGFERLNSWPPSREQWRRIAEGKPLRLIVGPVVRTRADRPKLKKACQDALRGSFDVGGFTVYVDEAQVAADARMMGLAADMETNMIAARDKGITMMTSYQAPRWVPRALADQSTWIAVWYTRDTDVVGRLAEITGRPKAELRGAVRSLEQNCLLLFSQNPREPIRATKPPKA